VLGLEDLVALPTVGAHPQLGKLTLTAKLPRRPGVYVFRDAGRRPLYVGKAVDLRRRVRSYFTGDDRRKIGGLLRELAAIDHIECSSELEASVLEVRMIHELAPRYNTRTKDWRSYSYVKLTLDEPWPRLSAVRAPRAADGCFYLGPVGSMRTARRIIEAIEAAIPIRRCHARLPAIVAPRAAGPCAPAQLGVACCPCAGATPVAEYQAMTQRLLAALTGDPRPLLDPLSARLRRLAGQQRYEEAAELRDRAAALSRALERQRRFDAIRRCGALTVATPDGAWATIDRGVMVDAGGAPPPDRPDDDARSTPHASRATPAFPVSADLPLPRHLVDEVATITSWLEARADRIRLLASEQPLWWPADRLPTFTPNETSSKKTQP